ncbi:MAG: hypothetical protein OXH46_04665 [Gemmatimonadetes bacterium]|nr:hypothetical protein [Gemmatimonadota bacterium]
MIDKRRPAERPSGRASDAEAELGAEGEAGPAVEDPAPLPDFLAALALTVGAGFLDLPPQPPPSATAG